MICLKSFLSSALGGDCLRKREASDIALEALDDPNEARPSGIDDSSLLEKWEQLGSLFEGPPTFLERALQDLR